MKNNLILIVDFGGQYVQLIARRVREAKVYSEIVPHTIDIESIKAKNPAGIIFSGGPNSVYEEGAPRINKEIFELGIPILGLCYGSQLMAHMFEGTVKKADSREYGRVALSLKNDNRLFADIKQNIECWMSHTDYIENPPQNFQIIAKTEACPVAAMACEEKGLYGIQFHPEVEHTEAGDQIIQNFIYKVCMAEPTWDMGNFAEEMIQKLKEQIGDKKAICALSGGVDSSVAAVMVHRAIGKNLTCVFVDHGLLRKDEGDQVEAMFKDRFDMNIIRVNAQERFLSKLAGVSEPEKKRKIIGEEFIRVFEEEKYKLKDADFLVQGTIYPDVVESGTDKAATIKSHHNVGGLPDDVDFELVEPLRLLFKDEVRQVGRELGIPEDLVSRQPFPGPGLAIRVIGEITDDKLEILREADFIFRDEIAKAGWDSKIWQYFAVLPDVKSVGVMGDERTYAHTIILRAVTSSDVMTADWAKIPYEILDKVSREIVNRVDGVNRIAYDITSKPPATVEWE